ncbi:hypothetical protein GNI_162240, partial [Gregarina niphandrodes]
MVRRSLRESLSIFGETHTPPPPTLGELALWRQKTERMHGALLGNYPSLVPRPDVLANGSFADAALKTLYDAH